MAGVARSGFVLLLLVVAGVGTSCGGAATGGTGPGGDGSGSKPTFSCTGATPANAILCPGTDAGLTSDAPRVVTGSPCGATACSYVCSAGYALGAGGCVSLPGGVAASFTDNGDGTVTVTDALGRSTWLRNANCTETVGGVVRTGGAVTWPQAQAWTGGLAAGACGLRDDSAAGDWLLPTYVQLLHLAVDLALPNPFTGVQSGVYWSSWDGDGGGDWADRARAVDLYADQCFDYPKVSPFYVWAVRQ
jgi:hypothetical protein